MKTRRGYYGRDLLIALAVVAAVGAGCDGCRDEPAPMPEPVAEEPSRRDQILDAATERGIDEILNREAPEDDR